MLAGLHSNTLSVQLANVLPCSSINMITKITAHYIIHLLLSNQQSCLLHLLPGYDWFPGDNGVNLIGGCIEGMMDQ